MIQDLILERVKSERRSGIMTTDVAELQRKLNVLKVVVGMLFVGLVTLLISIILIANVIGDMRNEIKEQDAAITSMEGDIFAIYLSSAFMEVVQDIGQVILFLGEQQVNATLRIEALELINNES